MIPGRGGPARGGRVVGRGRGGGRAPPAPGRGPPAPAPPPPKIVRQSAPLPSVSVPPITAGPSRVRLELYDSIAIPMSNIMPLSDIASSAFQHYALFCWLVTHRQPTFSDGPTDDEVAGMLADAAKTVSDLQDNGPASIYLVLRDAYSQNPLRDNQATERLILLALLADRPQLISKILRTFPETTDPMRLAALLQPYGDAHLENYSSTYAQPVPRGTDTSETTVLSGLPDHGLLRGISALGRLRILQNLLLRDAIRARYGMVTIMADPHVFGTSSIGEIESLVSKIDATVISNRDLYLPFQRTIDNLKSNFAKVRGTLSMGAAITQDAIRRLRLLLGVLNATDTLLDKMASGTATGLPPIASPAKIAAIVAPRAVV